MEEEEDPNWEKTVLILKCIGIFAAVYLIIRIITSYFNVPNYGTLIASGIITFGIYKAMEDSK